MKLQEYLDAKTPELKPLIDVLSNDANKDEDKIKALTMFAQVHRGLGAKSVLEEVNKRLVAAGIDPAKTPADSADSLPSKVK